VGALAPRKHKGQRPPSLGGFARQQRSETEEPRRPLLLSLSVPSSLPSLVDVLGHGFLSSCKEIVLERRPFPPCALGAFKLNPVSCLLEFLVLDSSKFLSSLFPGFTHMLLCSLRIFFAT